MTIAPIPPKLDPENLDITRFDVFALLCDSHGIIIHQLYFT